MGNLYRFWVGYGWCKASPHTVCQKINMYLIIDWDYNISIIHLESDYKICLEL